MKQHISAILFDKDGTLFDFNASWLKWGLSVIKRLSDDDDMRRALASACGLDFSAQKFIAHSVIVNGTLTEIIATWLAINHALDGKQIRQISHEEEQNLCLVPVCNLIDCLSAFHNSGFVLGVATNDSEGAAKRQLKQAGVYNYFDFIAGYDSGFGSKPGAGMVVEFSKRMGKKTHEIAMVGDSTHDMMTGRLSGAYCVAVLSGVARAEDICNYADVVLTDISVLKKHLENYSTNFN